MKKKEFLDQLNKELMDLNKEERLSAIKYYEDYFEDAGVENEEEVIKELETPKIIAETIKKDGNVSISDIPQVENSSKREPLPVWAIILIAIFLFPIGIPLITAFFGTIFGIFMALIGTLIGFTCAGIALLVCGLVISIFGIVSALGSPVNGLLLIGIGSILMGVGSILAFLMIKLSIVIIPPITRGVVDILKFPFRKRGI